jgi:hypothetical protein
MASPYTEDPRHSPHDVIVEIRLSEYAWWQVRFSDYTQCNQESDTEVDRQLAGIIKASRDVYLTTASTLTFLEASAERERAVTCALKRIRRARRWKKVGSILFRCLESLGRCTTGFSGPAPR